MGEKNTHWEEEMKFTFFSKMTLTSTLYLTLRKN